MTKFSQLDLVLVLSPENTAFVGKEEKPTQ